MALAVSPFSFVHLARRSHELTVTISEALHDLTLIGTSVTPLVRPFTNYLSIFKISFKLYPLWPLKDSLAMKHSILEHTIVLAIVVKKGRSLALKSSIVVIVLSFVVNNDNFSERRFNLIDYHA